MPDRIYNVLFLCTGNSARAVIAEAILNKIGAGKFRAYSAGSQPKGQVNPRTLQLLKGLGYDTSGYWSKSFRGELSAGTALSYLAAQLSGAILGTFLAHLMFELPVLQIASTARAGAGQWLAEAIATFGLLLTIFGCLASARTAIPYAVGLYITAAYWFTASTSFANPAVTVARALSDTFAGISPGGVPAFVGAQCAGALAATLLTRWLWPTQEAA